MKTIILFAFTVVFSIHLIAQKSKPYKIWVTQIDNSEVIKGYFYNADEYALRISKSVSSLDTASLVTINPEHIELIKLRRKGRIGRGLGIGAGAGAIFGGIIGIADGDDEEGLFQFSKEEKAVGAAIPLTIIGAGVGAGIGAIKKKFRIKGDIKIYNRELKSIRSYSLED